MVKGAVCACVCVRTIRRRSFVFVFFPRNLIVAVVRVESEGANQERKKTRKTKTTKKETEWSDFGFTGKVKIDNDGNVASLEWGGEVHFQSELT